MKKFVCSVCGYVHTAEELAADFRCPVCRVPASKFVEQKASSAKTLTMISAPVICIGSHPFLIYSSNRSCFISIGPLEARFLHCQGSVATL